MTRCCQGQSFARTGRSPAWCRAAQVRPMPTWPTLHGTSISFLRRAVESNTFGDFNPRARASRDRRPPVFAGNGHLHRAGLSRSGSTRRCRAIAFHAATEASSAIDLLAAAQRVLGDLKARQNGELFVFGFSQGGHSALALQRELERMRVKVEGTAVVGGIFDVERWFLTSLENETTLFQPLYVTYLLLAFDDIYDVYNRRPTCSAPLRREREYSSTAALLRRRRPNCRRRARLLSLVLCAADATVTTRCSSAAENAVDRGAGGAVASTQPVDEEAHIKTRSCRRNAAAARRDDRGPTLPVSIRQQLDAGAAAGGAMVRGRVGNSAQICGTHRALYVERLLLPSVRRTLGMRGGSNSPSSAMAKGRLSCTTRSQGASDADEAPAPVALTVARTHPVLGRGPCVTGDRRATGSAICDSTRLSARPREPLSEHDDLRNPVSVTRTASGQRSDDMPRGGRSSARTG